MVKTYIPERGDIVWTNFSPAAGHEQMGKRPALILSPVKFNKQIQLCLAAPVTSRVRGHGFEVLLKDNKLKGVVLCHQIKIIDYSKRGLKFVEKATDSVISEALAKVRTLVDE
jgi:mRNA interferase MazF